MIDRVEQKKGVTLLTLFQDFLSIYPNNVIACRKTSFVRVPMYYVQSLPTYYFPSLSHICKLFWEHFSVKRQLMILILFEPSVTAQRHKQLSSPSVVPATKPCYAFYGVNWSQCQLSKQGALVWRKERSSQKITF